MAAISERCLRPTTRKHIRVALAEALRHEARNRATCRSAN